MIKAVVVGLGPSQPQQKSVHLFANIVLVDKSQNIQPFLYELQSEFLHNSNFTSFPNHGLYSLPKGQFLFIGEVESIDKKKKMIILSNGGTVSYNHLISVKALNTETQNQEMNTIIRHFTDALKIQNSVINSLNEFSTHESIKTSGTTSVNTYTPSSDIANIAKINIPVSQTSSRDLISTDCLELQLSINR